MDKITENYHNAIYQIISAEKIYFNESIYGFLSLYYLEELFDFIPLYEIETSYDLRWTYSQYIAAWLPFEKHYPEIVEKINRLARVGKEEADV